MCSNCGAVAPGQDHFESAHLAITLGWLSLADDCYGCISIDHFCPKCREAAEVEYLAIEDQKHRSQIEFERRTAQAMPKARLLFEADPTLKRVHFEGCAQLERDPMLGVKVVDEP